MIANQPLIETSAVFSVLVNSSDGYSDCWAPFFTLLDKYWPDCNYPIYLNTEEQTWAWPSKSIQCTRVQRDIGRRLTWSECLLAALEQIETPLVLYFQEDYFIDKPVRQDLIEAAAQFMLSNPKAKHIALTRHCSHGPYDPHSEPWLQVIRQQVRYRIATQAALWRVETMKSYLRAEENAWMFEIFGTWRSRRRDDLFLSAKFGKESGGPPIDYLHTGIIKGKWLQEIQGVFKANGINVDYAGRGFYSPSMWYMRKYDVVRKLLSNPLYFFRQLLGRLGLVNA